MDDDGWVSYEGLLCFSMCVCVLYVSPCHQVPGSGVPFSVRANLRRASLTFSCDVLSPADSIFLCPFSSTETMLVLTLLFFQYDGVLKIDCNDGMTR